MQLIEIYSNLVRWNTIFVPIFRIVSQGKYKIFVFSSLNLTVVQRTISLTTARKSTLKLVSLAKFGCKFLKYFAARLGSFTKFLDTLSICNDTNAKGSPKSCFSQNTHKRTHAYKQCCYQSPMFLRNLTLPNEFRKRALSRHYFQANYRQTWLTLQVYFIFTQFNTLAVQMAMVRFYCFGLQKSTTEQI